MTGILRPNSQTLDDRQFYESWHDKQRDKPKLPDPPVAKVRLTSGGTPIDDEFRSKLRRLWREGVTIDAICLELNCGRTTVRRVRDEMKLVKRTTLNNGTGDEPVQLHLLLSVEMDRALARRCRVAHKPRAAYIRELIRRDLGM